jgi:hypothetical protein
VVDQVRRGVGHAPGSAGRAEASLLAGIGHQPLAPALLTADAQEAVGEDSTGEKGAALALDEAGDDAALIVGEGEKTLEVMLKDAVEDGGLGRAPLGTSAHRTVRVRRGARARRRRGVLGHFDRSRLR